MKSLFTVFVLLSSSCLPLLAADKDNSEISVKTLSIPPTVFGARWSVAHQRILTSEKDICESLFGKQGDTAENRVKRRDLGIVGIALYVFMGPPPVNNPMSVADGVSIIIYQFDSPAKADEWRDKNLQHENWQQEFTLLENRPYFAVDSKKSKQETAVIGKFVIQSTDIGDYSSHRKASVHLAKQIPMSEKK